MPDMNLYVFQVVLLYWGGLFALGLYCLLKPKRKYKE